VTRAAVNQEVKWPSDAYGRDPKLGLWRVILLKEQAGQRILPIWVAPLEGDVIAMQLEHVESPRPSIFDLTTHLLELSGAKIDKVAVTELRNNTLLLSVQRHVPSFPSRAGDPPPQPVSRLRTKGGGERLFPMGVEIIQDQMNGARRGVTLRDPFEGSGKFSRGTIFRSVGLMATGLGLDHAEHIGRAAACVLVVAARGLAGCHRGRRPQRAQQLHAR